MPSGAGGAVISLQLNGLAMPGCFRCLAVAENGGLDLEVPSSNPASGIPFLKFVVKSRPTDQPLSIQYVSVF